MNLLSLLDIVRAQSGRLRALETLVRELQAKLGQSSRNSSKPPSSDPPSAPPPPPRPARGRKAGGQVGHTGHQRPLVPPDQVHEPIELQPHHCPACQTALPADLPHAAPQIRTQVYELPPIEPIITEYPQHTVCCPQCQQFVTADLPANTPPGGTQRVPGATRDRADGTVARSLSLESRRCGRVPCRCLPVTTRQRQHRTGL